MILFTFRFTCVLEIMLPFFWLILLGLSWTDTSVNRASVEGNSTSELARIMKCHFCTTINTFNCGGSKDCPQDSRRCGTIAIHSSTEVPSYSG
ncbi:Gml [Phodopus roborovskii]|uniref:Gml protein n=1 Tax=Phodopus roborovskii TaxID=109678 RepID=A0AAV0A212_PHORO|nr:Gml [Phodopus roborovskii]